MSDDLKTFTVYYSVKFIVSAKNRRAAKRIAEKFTDDANDELVRYQSETEVVETPSGDWLLNFHERLEANE